MRRAAERGGGGALLPLALVLLALAAPRLAGAVTDAADVSAINGLYVALGSPTLPGWTGNGGDPCGELWQGVTCTGSSITGITMNAANLGGQLGSLGNFTSITTIMLSNNNIGGTIPEDLPVTLQNLFLSDNQLTGSIPSSLSKLKNLSAMSVNGNHLSGELPDTFDTLNGLVNLDISSNNLTGPLPPSVKSLASLTTLHMQDNQLSGTLNVLQDLPLKDLNIEDNLFSGPIPASLLNIPNFKKDGNPFNTSIAPSASPPSPLYEERQSRYDRNRSQLARVHSRVESQIKPSPVQQSEDVKKGPPGEVLDKRRGELNSATAAAAALPKKSPENQKEHIINFDRRDSDAFAVSPPPPPPPPQPPIERVVVNPMVPPEKKSSPPPRTSTPTSATPFSVASLQQYTNSFREENLIRESRHGKVYLAELPDGKLLEVLKLDNAKGRISVDDFLEHVTSISKIKHPNILELVGYCAEYGQRLLVYDHFSRKTLDDALHDREYTDSALSWNARLQVALGSGKAIEYLHESFQHPIVHQNFEPAIVLLDNKFSVSVAECGLADLVPSGSVTQLSGQMRTLLYYEAPEFQNSGIVTEKGDIYSFGVVMLELLTGRKPYDSSRPRAEQHLVRWASSQLHDIESLSKMVDPSIQGQCSEKALSRFADIISRCIQQEPEFRPPMSEIVQDLGRLVNATGEESE
ncbi:hypothetical protein QOZ80_6AG0547180 [Eleusine coracana subsp. coracana]|nr:hypothetical protein QOZ80_6AG0547180 [Eleusine coracana subsp. coracana]